MADENIATGREAAASTIQDRPELKRAMGDGLAGRRALMRAYEMMSERARDEETKTILRRFADDERNTYEKSENVVRRLGVEPSRIADIRTEVASVLSRAALTHRGTAYSDLRDLTILYGIEAAAHVGAEAMKKVSDEVGDDAWKREVDASIRECESHMDYLRGRIKEVASDAFGPQR